MDEFENWVKRTDFFFENHSIFFFCEQEKQDLENSKLPGMSDDVSIFQQTIPKMFGLLFDEISS